MRNEALLKALKHAAVVVVSDMYGERVQRLDDDVESHEIFRVATLDDVESDESSDSDEWDRDLLIARPPQADGLFGPYWRPLLPREREEGLRCGCGSPAVATRDYERVWREGDCITCESCAPSRDWRTRYQRPPVARADLETIREAKSRRARRGG